MYLASSLSKQNVVLSLRVIGSDVPNTVSKQRMLTKVAE